MKVNKHKRMLRTRNHQESSNKLTTEGAGATSKSWLVLVEQENSDVSMHLAKGANRLEAKASFENNNPDMGPANSIHVYEYSGHDADDFSDQADQAIPHLLKCIKKMNTDLANAIGAAKEAPWDVMIETLDKFFAGSTQS